jgi:GDP-D-mannose dehydratase
MGGIDARQAESWSRAPLFSPTDVDLLMAMYLRRDRTRWQHRVSFDELVAEMVAVDFKTVAGERSRVLTHAD